MGFGSSRSFPRECLISRVSWTGGDSEVVLVRSIKIQFQPSLQASLGELKNKLVSSINFPMAEDKIKQLKEAITAVTCLKYDSVSECFFIPLGNLSVEQTILYKWLDRLKKLTLAPLKISQNPGQEGLRKLIITQYAWRRSFYEKKLSTVFFSSGGKNLLIKEFIEAVTKLPMAFRCYFMAYLEYYQQRLDPRPYTKTYQYVNSQNIGTLLRTMVLLARKRIEEEGIVHTSHIDSKDEQTFDQELISTAPAEVWLNDLVNERTGKRIYDKVSPYTFRFALDLKMLPPEYQRFIQFRPIDFFILKNLQYKPVISLTEKIKLFPYCSYQENDKIVIYQISINDTKTNDIRIAIPLHHHILWDLKSIPLFKNYFLIYVISKIPDEYKVIREVIFNEWSHLSHEKFAEFIDSSFRVLTRFCEINSLTGKPLV